VLVDFGQVKDVGPEFRFFFGQMSRALMSSDTRWSGARSATWASARNDSEDGYTQLGNVYVGNLVKRMNESGAAYADRDMLRDSYTDIMKVLRDNPVVKVPPDLLFVGRVMGLLNGLSLTLGSRTNLLLEWPA
jgi:predicted unusual protein kinase regulating ubiquinone biosynthesis (AarF/ABC1/UbiB family)